MQFEYDEYVLKKKENSLPDEFFLNYRGDVYHIYKAFNMKLDKLPGDSPLTVQERDMIVRLADYVELYHVGNTYKPVFTPMSDFMRAGYASMIEHQDTLFGMIEKCTVYLHDKDAPWNDKVAIKKTIKGVTKILERVRMLPVTEVRPAPRFFLYGNDTIREHEATLMTMLKKVMTHFKDGLEKEYYGDATPADRYIETIIEEVDKLAKSVRPMLPRRVDAMEDDEEESD